MAVQNKFEIIRYANGAIHDGKSRGMYQLCTNDDVATVETAGYLNAHASKFSEGTGDVIMAVMDIDGTPVGKNYIVTRAAGVITLTPFLDATA